MSTPPARGWTTASMISLYPTLLGAAWASLAPAVQRRHACGSGVHARGLFGLRDLGAAYGPRWLRFPWGRAG